MYSYCPHLLNGALISNTTITLLNLQVCLPAEVSLINCEVRSSRHPIFHGLLHLPCTCVCVCVCVCVCARVRVRVCAHVMFTIKQSHNIISHTPQFFQLRHASLVSHQIVNIIPLLPSPPPTHPSSLLECKIEFRQHRIHTPVPSYSILYMYMYMYIIGIPPHLMTVILHERVCRK